MFCKLQTTHVLGFWQYLWGCFKRENEDLPITEVLKSLSTVILADVSLWRISWDKSIGI